MNFLDPTLISTYWPVFAFIMSVLVGGGSAMLGSKMAGVLFENTVKIELKDLSARVTSLEHGAEGRDKVLVDIQKDLAVITYQNELLLKGKELK